MTNRIDQPDDTFFKPANLEVRDGRGEEARPMADLAAVSIHDDKLPGHVGLIHPGGSGSEVPSKPTYGTPLLTLGIR